MEDKSITLSSAPKRNVITQIILNSRKYIIYSLVIVSK